MRLTEIEISKGGTWRMLGARRTLGEAKRTALTHVRTFFPESIGRKITFSALEGCDDLAIFYADERGNPVPVPMRLRHFEINVGDLVTIQLHTLAQQPDCHRPGPDPREGQHPCTHSHHQVGKVLKIYRHEGCGWVADVDWYPASHRYAGDTQFPSGVKSIMLNLLLPTNPFMREHEVLEGVEASLHERHCGGYISQGERCAKPVVRVFWRWADEVPWASNDTFGERVTYHQDSWRHADGTGPWDHCLYPIPLCEACGYEGHSHCRKCHSSDTGPTLKVTMEAYGNRTECTNPQCDYSDFYDIGD